MAKVAVLGAAGQIGQPLSLLLKMSPLVGDLALYDIVNAVGVGVDLDQIDTPGTVRGFLPADNGLENALSGAEVVVIPAGIARKPGMTRDDLFKTNAGVIRTLVTAVATTCPKAYVCVITNPVNSTLPIAVEVLKQHGVFDARKVFGVTTLDVVRGSSFVAQVLGDPNPKNYTVPVVGGHSGATILPLYSQCEPKLQLSQEQLDQVTYRVYKSSMKGTWLTAEITGVQFGGDEIVKAKAGAGSATTCMAYAGFRFIEAILRAAKGEAGICEAAYVFLPGIEGGQAIANSLEVDYFSTKLDLSTDGAVWAHPIGQLSEHEQKLLEKCLPELKVNVSKGIESAAAKMEA